MIRVNILSREVEGIGPMKPSNLPHGVGAKSYGEPRDNKEAIGFPVAFLLGG